MLGRSVCEREASVLDAMRAGDAPTGVRAHLETCRGCREAVAAQDWLRRMADTSDDPHDLPDPGLLWWRAQLVRRWQAERLASAPIESMQRVELWVGLASLVALLFWVVPMAWRWALGIERPVSLDAETVTRWASLLDSPTMMAALPLAAALLGVATLVTITRFMLTE